MGEDSICDEVYSRVEAAGDTTGSVNGAVDAKLDAMLEHGTNLPGTFNVYDYLTGYRRVH